jgi:regulator of protease activity HflC (stomatin/prohibitin superfamily)
MASEIKERLQRFLDTYRTGITVTQVNVQSAAAPREVQEAFDDVIRAREDEQRSRNQAETSLAAAFELVDGALVLLRPPSIILSSGRYSRLFCPPLLPVTRTLLVLLKTSCMVSGLHVKVPYVNQVRKFDGRLMTLDAPTQRFLTLEKKAVMVDAYAKWRVKDAERFYTATSGLKQIADERLSRRLESGLR